MQELQRTLDILDHKIEGYENAILNKEKELREGIETKELL